MGDRLERTDVWQQYHDRVTGEVPVIVVVSDNEDHDLFRKAFDELTQETQARGATLDWRTTPNWPDVT